MTDLGLSSAELTPDNLARLVADMGCGPGWLPSSDLYTWYVGMCSEGGFTPVTRKMFGLQLKRTGRTPSIRRVHGRNTRGWFIPRHLTRAD